MNWESVTLDWYMFEQLTAARSNFPSAPCVYVQADPARNPLRIGKASEGLEVRYRSGNGYALNAAMHGSGNLVFLVHTGIAPRFDGFEVDGSAGTEERPA